MRTAIQFYFGSTYHELSNVSPTLTVLAWLREGQRRVGTKEGCNEGDCGACTVAVVRLEEGRLVWRAVNACIHFIWMLDGAQLFTVEDIRSPTGALHPVQQAMVEHHGSQCGFCTPGFVVSMFVYCQNPYASLDDDTINQALAGNLCRCTGYSAITRAMKHAVTMCRTEENSYDETIKTRLLTLVSDQTVQCQNPEGCVTLPATVQDLAMVYVQNPEAILIAGGTDVGLWVTKGLRTFPHVIGVSRVPELRRIERTENTLKIGAAVTYTEAYEALVAWLPGAAEVLRRIGSTQVRNMGTVCGNIANGSPIGDGPPVLIAAKAVLTLRHGDQRRRLPLDQYFIAYGKQDRKAGEFIESVDIPFLKPGTLFRSYKISKRFDQDISAVLAAFSMTLNSDGRVENACFAFGGMAATPKRAFGAERALVGHKWNNDTLQRAHKALQDDFSPLSDVRASAWYRQTVARNLVKRFFLETSSPLNDEEKRLPSWDVEV